MAVHLDRTPLLAAFVLVSCRFDKRLVRHVDRHALPQQWRDDPPPSDDAAIGDAWIREGRSAVLGVPSAIIEAETNFLLNPRHPDFAAIAIGRPEPFEIDRRLIK